MMAGLDLFLVFLAALLSADVVRALAKGNTLLLALVAVVCLMLAIAVVTVRV